MGGSFVTLSCVLLDWNMKLMVFDSENVMCTLSMNSFPGVFLKEQCACTLLNRGWLAIVASKPQQP